MSKGKSEKELVMAILKVSLLVSHNLDGTI